MNSLLYITIIFFTAFFAGIFVAYVLYKILHKIIPNNTIGPEVFVVIGVFVWIIVVVLMMVYFKQPCDEICTGKTPICSYGKCVKCNLKNKCPDETPKCNIDGSCTLAT